MKKALPRYIHHHSKLLVIFLILLMASISIVSKNAVTGHAGGMAVMPQATTQHCNNSSIAVPASGTSGPANPYPSAVNVTGLTGSVSNVTVTLNNLSIVTAASNELDILLVAPSGANMIILSDAGGIASTPAPVTLTLDDAAATPLPSAGGFTTGTFKPTNLGAAADTFPAPAPTPSNAVGSVTFASTFTGIDPNGAWSLYVLDDTGGPVGQAISIAGGWCLNITTAPDAVTSTAVTSSLNPSFTGDPVTFTATVTSGGNPVTSGTVTFKEGATTLSGPTAVNGSGQASFTTSTLSEGSHVITAEYNGSPGLFAISKGNVTQVVDNHTVVNGNNFCNPGTVTINESTQAPTRATPYPSRIFVSGLTGAVCNLTVTLSGIRVTNPNDLDLMLVGPNGASMLIMSDADSNISTIASPVTITLDDAAASFLPSAGGLSTGTFKPTNNGAAADLAFPAPAPAPINPVGSVSFASVFNGADPNGTWSLYVVDDVANGSSGSIVGGWCLTFTIGTATEILTQPMDETVCSGDSASFDVVATGSGTVTYQWRRGTTPLVNGGNISGADTPTLTINPATSADAASNYNVVVTGSCGSAVSNNASLTINQPPTTATVGGGQGICANGTTAGLGGNTPAVGTGIWSIVSGGTGTFSSNTDPNATFTHTGGAGPIVVRWTISNPPCADSSADVTITINPSPATPTITPNPSTVCANSTGNQASGPAGASSYAWTISNGTITSATNIQTITYTAGATGSVTLNLTVTNSFGCSASNSASVPINPPPTAVCKNITVALNSSGTVSITAADVDNGSTAPCGLGSMTVSPNSFTCANKGANSVTLTVTDTAGNNSQCTATVTVVDNTPPVIDSCPSNITVPAASGLCSAVVNFNVTATDNCDSVTVACTPPSGSPFPVGTTSVSCTATDTSNNTSSPCNFTVTVTNPAPVVTITGPPSGAIFATNTSVTFTGTFTDAGGGTHTAQWSFVSDTQTLSQAGVVNELTGAVSATRSFSAPGVYLITLTVTDSCGISGSANTVGVLTALIVIYDPEGAFLTGGGWIDSPAGAYVANPAATGKANYGLNAKYKNNATFPTGNTEFHLNSVNFRFKATSYDWLVVTGAKAQYQGSGTVNNQGNYGFIVTVIDGQISGGTDKFRIKIWDKNNNDAVVYDSQMNDPNSADPTITPGGGNIVIHN